jgi:hypothetical protein
MIPAPNVRKIAKTAEISAQHKKTGEIRFFYVQALGQPTRFLRFLFQQIVVVSCAPLFQP